MFESGLNPLGRGEKERHARPRSTLICMCYWWLTVFNVTQYWVIVISCCFIGVSLSHINISPCCRKSVPYTEKQLGSQNFFFYHDVKTHKHEVKFSPPAGPRVETFWRVSSAQRVEKQLAQLRGLHTSGVMVAWSFMMLGPLSSFCNGVIKNIFLEVVCETAERS